MVTDDMIEKASKSKEAFLREAEKLLDYPWDTVAQVQKDMENKILDNLLDLEKCINHGSDWDIDKSIGDIVIY